MAHRLTEIYAHLVFAVKKRQPLITEFYREELQRYLAGVCKVRKHSLLIHYAMPDHYHALVRLYPTDALANLLYELKRTSSKWLNDTTDFNGAFSWQTGYGAFSHKAGDLEQVFTYIQNQPAHHQKHTLEQEVDMINTIYKSDWQLD